MWFNFLFVISFECVCTHIWSEEELNAVDGSFQSQSSDQEDRKD